jgi:hypothetical protein
MMSALLASSIAGFRRIWSASKMVTDALGTKILVGWNNSREAARAVSDAIPLLTKAAAAGKHPTA